MKRNLSTIKQNSKIALSKTRSLIGTTNKILAGKTSTDLVDYAILSEKEVVDSDSAIQEEIDDEYLQYLIETVDLIDLDSIEQDMIEIDELSQDLVQEQSSDIVDDDWMERLWKWADENGVPDFKWIETEKENHKEGGNRMGLPRDREKLLNLNNLDLGISELTELPKEIGNLTKLERLGLSFNHFSKLPKEIGNLTNLKNLDLSISELAELPKEIGNLTKLERLDLSINDLTELPKEIGQLTNLLELWLLGNPNLILTKEQKEWIEKLEANGCKVGADDDIFARSKTYKIPEINEDELPF